MHILASHYRSEFLACPQLVRFEYAMGRDDFEPTLLIKGSTLLLKYVVMGARMKLAFARLDDRLLYGLKIYDDPEKAGLLWSILEHEEKNPPSRPWRAGNIAKRFYLTRLRRTSHGQPLELTSREPICWLFSRRGNGAG